MKKLLIAALVVANGWLATAPVHAAPVLSLVPNASTIAVGGSVNVNLVISGLDSVGEIVSGFDLDVFFDPAVLSAMGLSTAFAPWGTGGDVSLSQSFAGPGHVAFKLTARLGDDILDGLQGDSVLLSSILFLGLADGFSTISYGLDPITERLVLGRGDLTLAHGTTDTCVAVGTGACAVSVPEPASLPLLVLALVGMGLALRRQRQASSAGQASLGEAAGLPKSA